MARVTARRKHSIPEVSSLAPAPSDSEWTFACADWERRIMSQESLLPPEDSLPMFNFARADRAEKLFRKLKLPDVPNQPDMDEAAGEWFIEIVRLCAGGYGEDGVQRLRELTLMVSKKNNKTTGAAALMLVLMLMSPRPRADFILIGPTQELALLAFNQSSGMVGCEPVLQNRLHSKDYIKTILDRTTGCKLSVKSFDMKIATGSRPALVLLDEIHLLTHPDAPRIVGQLRGGQVSIPEGQVIQLTTQSDVRPFGYWKQELDKARAIRDGKVHLPGIAPVLYEFPKSVIKDEKQWRNPKNWPLVNPNMNRSVSMSFLENAYEEALTKGSVEVRRWVSQHLNIEVSEVGMGDDAWAGAALWSSTENKAITLEYMLAVCDVIETGIDGGGLDDVLGLAVLGRHSKTGHWLCWVHGWLTETAMKRRKAIEAQLRDFEKAGELTVCPAGVDMTLLIEHVMKIEDAGLLDKVGLDPAGIAADIANALEEEGIDREERIIGIPQGWRLASSYKMIERRMDNNTFEHCAHGMMDWMVGNARIDTRGIVSKMVSGAGKIDCVTAMATGARLLSEAGELADPTNITVLGGPQQEEEKPSKVVPMISSI